MPPSPSWTPGSPPAWPTEPSKPAEPARPRSQVAVFAVCALAMGIVCGAAGSLTWGAAGMFALAAGIAIGLLADVGRRFGSVPGAVAALLTMGVLTVALAFVGGSALAFGCVPLAGSFVLGLDWHLVRRLRPLPFAFGFLVVIGVAGGDAWAYPAGLVWLALALGALASLEADRRAGQVQVEAVTAGPPPTDLRTGDLATTILIALAIALVAALVLSTPSCQRADDPLSGRSGGGQFGSGELGEPGGEGSGSGSGRTGSGEPGSSGTGTGSGRIGQGGSEHLYVPDPDGRFLVPNDGEARTDGTEGIPSPDLLPDEGEPLEQWTTEDGTVITAERLADGDGRITLEEPGGATRTFTYRERPDGLIEIQERDADGEVGPTLYYDPEGRIATDDETAVSDGQTPSGQQEPEPSEEDEAEASHLDGRLLALIAVVLAALGALIWWLTRRTPSGPPPDAPPWAVRLAREIDREGAARGRSRRRSQPLGRYADDLRAGPLPDPRLPDVADVVSTALFARTDPGPEAQRWAESTWAEILEAHPVPSRSDKRRAKAEAGATRD